MEILEGGNKVKHKGTLGVMDVLIILIVFTAQVNAFWSIFFIYVQFSIYKVYINKAVKNE